MFNKKKDQTAPAPKPARKPLADGGRVLRNGAFSSAITAVAIVLAVVLVLVVDALPEKYTQLDISEAGIYTLTDTTNEILAGLDQDVTIYYLAQTGNEDPYLTRLLDRYADSGKVSWIQRDPAVYPNFAAEYGAESATEGSLIVVCGEKHSLVDSSTLYTAEYTADYTGYTYSFDGENGITTAIFNVTSGESSQAYYATNHGEAELDTTLVTALNQQNIQATAVDLLVSGIPEDCDLLILNDPQTDLAGADALVDESELLRQYLAGGGKLLLTTDAFVSTPNLETVLAEFGLSRASGLLVEGDSQYHLSSSVVSAAQTYLLPTLATGGQSGVADGLSSTMGYLLPQAHGIVIAENLPDSVDAEALLTTSSSAFAKALEGDENGQILLEQSADDPTGPFTTAAWACNADTGAQVVWVGSGLFGNSNIDVYGMNSQFLLASAAAMTGQSSETLVGAKALESDTFATSAATVLGLGAVFVLLIPAVLLVAGIAVSVLRRRR